MKNLTILALIAIVGVQLGSSQVRSNKQDTRESIRASREEALRENRELKKQTGAEAISPGGESNDLDSFGKNAQFLGSSYAGTVYYFYSCDPQVLADEAATVLAPDDHCYAYVPGSLNQKITFDPVWQITIPGKTVDNVIYPILGNSIIYNNGGSTGSGQLVYSPRITIQSEAFNDPLAVVNGNPLNGSYTTFMPGTNVKGINFLGHERSTENYASVNGRGFSRAYFRSIGLPESVINKLFKRPMTLKFGMFTGAQSVYDFVAFSYTIRLMGQ